MGFCRPLHKKDQLLDHVFRHEPVEQGDFPSARFIGEGMGLLGFVVGAVGVVDFEIELAVGDQAEHHAAFEEAAAAEHTARRNSAEGG